MLELSGPDGGRCIIRGLLYTLLTGRMGIGVVKIAPSLQEVLVAMGCTASFSSPNLFLSFACSLPTFEWSLWCCWMDRAQMLEQATSNEMFRVELRCGLGVGSRLAGGEIVVN